MVSTSALAIRDVHQKLTSETDVDYIAARGGLKLYLSSLQSVFTVTSVGTIPVVKCCEVVPSIVYLEDVFVPSALMGHCYWVPFSLLWDNVLPSYRKVGRLAFAELLACNPQVKIIRTVQTIMTRWAHAPPGEAWDALRTDSADGLGFLPTHWVPIATAKCAMAPCHAGDVMKDIMGRLKQCGAVECASVGTATLPNIVRRAMGAEMMPWIFRVGSSFGLERYNLDEALLVRVMQCVPSAFLLCDHLQSLLPKSIEDKIVQSGWTLDFILSMFPSCVERKVVGRNVYYRTRLPAAQVENLVSTSLFGVRMSPEAVEKQLVPGRVRVITHSWDTSNGAVRDKTLKRA